MADRTALRDHRTSPSSPLRRGRVEDWLASAHPSPSQVHEEWSSPAQLALIPLGRRFDAVRIPGEVVHAVVESDEPSIVGTWLAECLGGPVIHDPGFRRYYALVPPSTVQLWTARAAECLGGDAFLGVPRTDHTELNKETLASYWLVPVARPGHLCETSRVLQLVILGGCLVDGEDDES